MKSDLSIGGIRIRTTCEAGPVLPIATPSYRDFANVPPKASVDIHISLKFGPRPSICAGRKLFDAENWTIHTDGSCHFLELGSNTAIWDSAVSAVSLYTSAFLQMERDGQGRLANPLGYPLDQLLLMHHMASRQGLILHAAGADFGGKGIIFPGRSGAGKSTLSSLLAHTDGSRLLSDDRMIVRSASGAFLAYGTPWPGDAGIAVNQGVPLAAICFISHALVNTVTALVPADAARRLLPLASVPWYDSTLVSGALATIDAIVATVPAYELAFALSPRVGEFARSFAQSL